MKAAWSLDAIGNTPLIELPHMRPAGGAHVHVKWEGGNPTGSMKDRMALAMIEGAERENLLEHGQRIVEYTGGSTGSSLAFVCAAKARPISLVTADCFSREKIETMRAFGADVRVLKTPEGKVHPDLFAEFRANVQEIQRETGAYWTDQMNNVHHVDGYRAMGEEILRDLPDVDHFVMSVGTGGSAMGVARILKAARPTARVTLVEPDEAAFLSRGEKGTHRVEGIAMSVRPPHLKDDLYDDVVTVPEADGRTMARRLARESGLLVGTSTGLNVSAALRAAAGMRSDEHVVTVAVDTGLKYLAGDLFHGT